MQSHPANQNRILRLPEVIARTGASRTSLWRWEKAGLFPRRRQIGPSAVGYLEREVDAWVNSRSVVGGEG